MALTIADLIVKVGADVSGLDQGMGRARSEAQGLGRSLSHSLDQATASSRMLGAAMQQTQTQARGLGAAMTAALAGFAGGVGAGAISMAMQVVMRGFQMAKSAAIDFNSTLEQSTLAFSTMLKSSAVAGQLLDQLKQFAALTPFEFPDLLQSSRRLLAFRFTAEQIIPLMTAIGDVSAAAGANGAETIGRLTTALGQAQAKGRIMGEELLQLTEAGVSVTAVLEILAKNTGKSMAEIQEALGKGRIAASAFIAAFMEWSKSNVGGMMAEQAKTFQGAMSTIKDSLVQFAATAFRPIFTRLSSLAQAISGAVQTTGFQEWAAMIAVYVDHVLGVLGVLATGFARTFAAIAQVVLTIGAVILRGLSLINPFVRHSPSLVESVEEGFGRRIPDAIAGMAAAVQGSLGRAGAAVAAFKAAAAGGLRRRDDLETAETLGMVARLGPGAPAAYLAARGAIAGLEGELADLGEEVRRQEEILRGMERAMRPLQEAFDAASRRVQRLRDTLGEAQAAMRRLADEGRLPGEAAHERALQENRRRQAEIQLRMNELRRAGVSTPTTEGETRTLQRDLDRLRAEEERLRLTGELTFGQQRQRLQRAADTQPTVSAGDRLAGIVQARSAIAEVAQALPEAEQAMAGAQAALEAQRAQIELQQTALADLRETYNAISRELQAQKQAMDEILGAARDLDARAKAAERAAKEDEDKGPMIGAGIQVPGQPLSAGVPDGGKAAQRLLDRYMGVTPELTPAESLEAELNKQLAALTATADGMIAKVQGMADAFSAQFGIEGGLQGALTAFQKGWSTNMDPVRESLGAFIKQLGEDAPKAMAAFEAGWTGTMQPTLARISQWLQENTGPSLRDMLINQLAVDVPNAMSRFRQAWDALGPTREAIAGFFAGFKTQSDKLLAMFDSSGKALDHLLSDIGKVFSGIGDEFSTLGRMFELLGKELGKVGTALSSLQAPEWLTRLIGIVFGGATRTVDTGPGLPAPPNSYGGGGGGPVEAAPPLVGAPAPAPPAPDPRGIQPYGDIRPLDGGQLSGLAAVLAPEAVIGGDAVGAPAPAPAITIVFNDAVVREESDLERLAAGVVALLQEAEHKVARATAGGMPGVPVR